MSTPGSVPGALVPTKEKFYDSPWCSGGAECGLGGFHGCDVDDDDERAYINCCLPEDYHAMQEIELVFIALATLTPMTVTIVTNYCQNGEAYSTHNEPGVDKSINTTLNQLTELDITDCVDIAPLVAGDYIGVQVWRETGKNTDALIMGVRIKYV